MDKQLIDYFIDQTNRRFDKVDKKLNELLEFKWKIIGGSVIFSLFATLVFNLLLKGSL